MTSSSQDPRKIQEVQEKDNQLVHTIPTLSLNFNSDMSLNNVSENSESSSDLKQIMIRLHF